MSRPLVFALLIQFFVDSAGATSHLGVDLSAELATLPQEAPWSHSYYIVPNERGYFLFQNANAGKKGALVSVGTFRSLSATAYGNFSHAVWMDANLKTVEFNQKQIEALKRSHSFAEFLAVLGETPKAIDVIERLIKSDYADFRARSADEERLRKEHYRGDPNQKQIHEYVREILNLAMYSPAELKHLASPDVFGRIKALADQGRIYALAGDLSGPETVRRLSDLLRAHHISVGILDVSNVPDYIFGIETLGNIEGYVKNLRELPFAQNARVNFTLGRGASPVRDHFSYHSVQPTDYISAIEMLKLVESTSIPKSYWDYVSLLKHNGGTLDLRVRCTALFSKK